MMVKLRGVREPLPGWGVAMDSIIRFQGHLCRNACMSSWPFMSNSN